MRNTTITYAKAIGILLMVLVHSQFSHWGNIFINMFHMPLFFFFSGYCFKEKYLTDAKEFTWKRFKGVYLPFVKWSLLFLLLHNVFFYLNIYNGEYGFRGNVSHLYTIEEYGTRAINIVTRLSDAEQLLGGYWFLHTLFFGSFLFYVTLRLCQRTVLGGVFLIVTCLLSLYFAKSIPYFGIGAREFLAAFFMLAGFYYKKEGFGLEERFYVTPIALVLLVLGCLYWPCCMLTLTWQKMLPYTMSAIAGTLMVFAIAKSMTKMEGFSNLKEFMGYIGDHTLEILTWHFLSFKLVSLIIIWGYSIPIVHLAEFPVIEVLTYQGWWVAYFMVGIIIPIVGCKLSEVVRKFVKYKSLSDSKS